MAKALPLKYTLSTKKPPWLTLVLPRNAEILDPDPSPLLDTGSPHEPFNLTFALQALCADIAKKSPALSHLDISKILFTMVEAKQRSLTGLQARVIPLRFEEGRETVFKNGKTYRCQGFMQDGIEMLYLVSFLVPRFLDRDFEYKLITVFHELYHISPLFNGDIRRFAGRCSAHTGSQKNYDAHVKKLAEAYLGNGADYRLHHFLRLNFNQLCKRHGGVRALKLPRPKLVPVPPPTQY